LNCSGHGDSGAGCEPGKAGEAGDLDAGRLDVVPGDGEQRLGLPDYVADGCGERTEPAR
jgi:hypothetical protein